ncbi:hypothetical protein J1N35_039925 [Gossypium stocksii]|uniref:Reverse transcriptase domain-containing protein n=1 Tax=Gossypium stocksii TaxID=47602 RepID=A0A9D3UD13_9ROSI|nr:hypothetical protein J1N35_039925 [Gossypium stocksii]
MAVKIDLEKAYDSLDWIFITETLNDIDDLVLFNAASVDQMETINRVLGRFCAVLGKYLGVPLLHQRVTRDTFQYIVENMRKKLAGWKSKLLSFAGRITLAKAVLAAIPVCYVVDGRSKGVCYEMEKIIRYFVWGTTEEKKGYIWSNGTICAKI